MSQTVAYIRVSTDEQDTRNQKFEILSYYNFIKRKMPEEIQGTP